MAAPARHGRHVHGAAPPHGLGEPPVPVGRRHRRRVQPTRHEREIAAHESFNYALLDGGETELLGCVYVDPPEKAGDAGAEVSWWVVDRLVGTEVERALDAFVPAWLAERWPLRRPRYVGRDLSWAEWIALPER